MAYGVGFGSSDILAQTQMQVNDVNKKNLEAHEKWLKENPGYRTNPEKVKEHRELFGDLYTDKVDAKFSSIEIPAPKTDFSNASSADILAETQMQVADYESMREVAKQMKEAQAKYQKVHQNLLNNGKEI